MAERAPELPEKERRDHPLRSALSAEMHMRKLPSLSLPAQVVQFVFIADYQQSAEGLRLLVGSANEVLPTDARFFSGRIGSLDFVWEAHSEFCTYTLIKSTETTRDFDLRGYSEAIAKIFALPGEIIRSTNTLVVAHDGSLEADWTEFFSEDDLIISEVFDGRARIWSDFRLHDDGFGRMLVENANLAGNEASALLQRLLELGNYRKMALLGLPIAKTAMGSLDKIERELADVAESLDANAVDTQTAMSELNRIGAKLSQISVESRYRMSATAAYFAIVKERIRALSPTAAPGKMSLSDFTERRLAPAMRTCEAFSRRLRELIQDYSDVSNRLRVRIDDELARRNQDLLGAMNSRTELQLRLQQTVEGLSIVAITYYAIGIWEAVQPKVSSRLGLELESVTFGIALLVPVTVWLLLRHIRRGHAVRLET